MTLNMIVGYFEKGNKDATGFFMKAGHYILEYRDFLPDWKQVHFEWYESVIKDEKCIIKYED